MEGIAKKFLGYKAVVCGNVIEFYSFEKPFYADYVREYEIIRGTADETEKRCDSLTRARKNVRQLVLCNLTPHTKLLTLTYAETQLEKSVTQKHLSVFFKSMKRQGYELKYLYILERQKERGKKEGNAGTIHPHIIIFNDEIIPIYAIKKAWPHGSIDIHVLNGLRATDGNGSENEADYKLEKINNAGAYICKYLKKEDEIEWGSRCYRCSIGLKRPVEHKFYSYQYHNEYNGMTEYATDNLTGYNILRSYCGNKEYNYHKKIEFVASDGKLVNNTIYCTQVEIKPEYKSKIIEFCKSEIEHDYINTEIKRKGVV